MSLRARLITGFVVVALMSLVVGIFGIRNMSSINDASRVMYDNELQGLSLSKEANLNILTAVNAEENVLRVTTQAQKDALRQKWTEHIANYEQLMSEAELKFVTAEGKAAIQTASAAYLAWMPLSSQIFDLADEGTPESLAKAVMLSSTEAEMKGQTLNDALAALAYRKDANAQKLNAAANALYAKSILMMIILISVAMILGIVIALVQSRSVLKTVGGEPDKIAKLADRVATGDLTADTSKAASVTGIHRSLLLMIEKLSEITLNMQNVAAQVSSGSQQLSGTAQGMSQGATEQASSVEEISSSMEEMTSSIKQNAENASATEKIALKSAQIAEAGGKEVNQTVAAMKQIAGKISIIEEIARSTNMLALNASIEAARAGEYGKGFAVVASEVGKLAERSQKEAGEINKLSAESVQIAEHAGSTIQSMIPEIKRTAELVQEISASSGEQDVGAQQINAAILQLDQVVQQNASGSEESASMSEELASQAEQMQDGMSFFKIRASAETETPAKQVAAEARKPLPAGVSSPAQVQRESVQPRTLQPARTNGILLHLDEDSGYDTARDSMDSDFKEF